MDGRVKSCGCLAKEYKASEKPWLRGYRLPDMDDDEQEESDFDDRFAEAVDEVLDE